MRKDIKNLKQTSSSTAKFEGFDAVV